jgi:hypothetical protein
MPFKGDPALDRRFAISELYGASLSGSWSSAVGEPAERDIKTRENSEAILKGLSRLSPAYKLYKDLLDQAEKKPGLRSLKQRRGRMRNDLYYACP